MRVHCPVKGEPVAWFDGSRSAEPGAGSGRGLESAARRHPANGGPSTPRGSSLSPAGRLAGWCTRRGALVPRGSRGRPKLGAGRVLSRCWPIRAGVGWGSPERRRCAPGRSDVAAAGRASPLSDSGVLITVTAGLLACLGGLPQPTSRPAGGIIMVVLYTVRAAGAPHALHAGRRGEWPRSPPPPS